MSGLSAVRLFRLLDRQPLGFGRIGRVKTGRVAGVDAQLSDVGLAVHHARLPINHLYNSRHDKCGVVLTLVVPNPDDGVVRHGGIVA